MTALMDSAPGLPDWERALLADDEIERGTSAFDRVPVTSDEEARLNGLRVVEDVDELAPVYLDEYRRMVKPPSAGLEVYCLDRAAHFRGLAVGMADQPDLVAAFGMVADELDSVRQEFG